MRRFKHLQPLFNCGWRVLILLSKLVSIYSRTYKVLGLIISQAETAANANAKNSAGGLQASSLAIAGFICMTTFFLTIDSIV
jgi:hypothetical protein